MRENAVRVAVLRPRMRGQIPRGICEVHRLFDFNKKTKGADAPFAFLVETAGLEPATSRM